MPCGAGLTAETRILGCSSRFSPGRLVSSEGLESRQKCLELLAVDDALSRLEELDPRKAAVVKYRFFMGLTIEETATALEVSVPTVNTDWKWAKAWLKREMRPPEAKF